MTKGKKVMALSPPGKQSLRNTQPSFFEKLNSGLNDRKEVAKLLKENSDQKETLNKLICKATDAVNNKSDDSKLYKKINNQRR